jgi:hypothetical protein
MAYFFQFEQDFVTSLRCIPMQVRLKLDTCGVKLKLDQWNHFNHDDRQQLLDRPCDTPQEAQAYRAFLHDLIQARTGQNAKDLEIDPDPPWLDADAIPTVVQAKAARMHLTLSQMQWAQLEPLQRFALIKLSRSNHENSNFLPALQEFGLVSTSHPID